MEKFKRDFSLFNFVLAFFIINIVLLIGTMVLYFSKNPPHQTCNPYVYKRVDESELKEVFLFEIIILTVIPLISYEIASFRRKKIVLKKSFNFFMFIVFFLFFIFVSVIEYDNVKGLKKEIEEPVSISINHRYFIQLNSKDLIYDKQLAIKYSYYRLGIVPFSYLVINCAILLDKIFIRRKDYLVNNQK